MKLHPFFSPVWIAIFALPATGFAAEDTGLTQGVPTICQPPEESATFRRALAMTDRDVETECGLEKGAGFDLCKSVVNHMRDSAKQAAEARTASCNRVVLGLARPNDGQSDSFLESAHKARDLEEGNIRQAKIYGDSLGDTKKLKDQMLRNQKGLFADRRELEQLNPEVKLRPSVVSGGDDRAPATRAATLPPVYDEFQVHPSPITNYTSPRVIEASASGSKTLAEYEEKLPYMIERQGRLLKMMDDFEEETRVKQIHHQAAALELGKQAASLLQEARKMGAAEDSLDLPLKAGPKGERAGAAAVAGAKGKEGLPTKAKSALESPGSGGKNGFTLTASPLALSAKPAETSEETAMLDSFQSRLMEDGKGKLAAPERSRLRDLLRRKGGARGRGESSDPGELVAELEESAQEKRAPASVVGNANERRGIVRLDVQGAIKEIESQLEEMDRSMGILSVDSESLFDRVRATHRSREKNGAVGRES